MTYEEKYKIALDALHLLGSYEYCDCGCPKKRAARVNTPVYGWSIANQALIELGIKPVVYSRLD